MTDMKHAKFGMGAPVKRLEDKAFITGNGRYTDDISPEGTLHGYVLRSPYAHATFTIGDTTDAAASPGVALVLTGADVTHLKPLTCTAETVNGDGSRITRRDIPVLCTDTVRHVGDAVAFIVADTTAHARQAAELIEVDYDELPAITDTEASLNDGAPLVYEDAGTNEAFRLFLGDQAKTDEVFAKAAHVSEIKLINNRLVCNYMEPRACLSEYENGEFTVTVCSQGVHGIRGILANIMGLAPESFRVITPDVGGGFGTKVFCYREYALTMEAARRLERPVKWTCDRGEHFMADAHGRDNVTTLRMAMDENHKFLALDIQMIAAMGGYLHQYGPFIPWLGMTMATGIYDIPTMAVTCRGAYTNTTPTDAYRGAGRPEAAYHLERLVDQCALDAGLAPDEIRRRNFIRTDQLPYTTPGNRMYDTGEFEEHMKIAMERADWGGFSARNEEAKSRGKARGIGMATYIEACAFMGSEPAFITLREDGTFLVRIGTQSNGQGHKTAYAQLAAEKLGVDPALIEVSQGDTAELKAGGGTGGSRSVPLGGVSVAYASETLAEKIKRLAADELEAAEADIELDGGSARIVGTDRTVSFSEIAAKASEDDRNAEGEFKQHEATYPNGTHICEVEIDPETGEIEVVAYTIVDDFGVTVNPDLLAGQVHGGVVQGIGQALLERTVYDEFGQLVTASFLDYTMPRADNVPNFHFETRNVPSTTNALGMKGAGEAGSIGSCPAVMNAVAQGLRDNFGVQHIDMPAVPQIVWQAIQDAKG